MLNYVMYKQKEERRRSSAGSKHSSRRGSAVSAAKNFDSVKNKNFFLWNFFLDIVFNVSSDANFVFFLKLQASIERVAQSEPPRQMIDRGINAQPPMVVQASPALPPQQPVIVERAFKQTTTKRRVENESADDRYRNLNYAKIKRDNRCRDELLAMLIDKRVRI